MYIKDVLPDELAETQDGGGFLLVVTLEGPQPLALSAQAIQKLHQATAERCQGFDCACFQAGLEQCRESGHEG